MFLTLGLGLPPSFIALFKETPCYFKLFPFCLPVFSCEKAGQDLFMTFKLPLTVILKAQFLRGDSNNHGAFLCSSATWAPVTKEFFKAEVSLHRK